MRLRGCILLVFLFCMALANAQSTKTVPLKPIYKQGWKYFYDGKRMNSVYALQIPLQALENKEINERFRKFKQLQRLRIVAYVPSLIYLFTSVHFRGGGHRGYSARDASTETILLLTGIGIAGDITFNAMAHHQIGRAIDIYNVQIAEKSSLSMSVQPLPNQNSVGLTYHFRF